MARGKEEKGRSGRRGEKRDRKVKFPSSFTYFSILGGLTDDTITGMLSTVFRLTFPTAILQRVWDERLYGKDIQRLVNESRREQ